MKTLVLFTGSYPYSSKAENTFIEPELMRLRDDFSRIIIVPSSCKGTRSNLSIEYELDESLSKTLLSSSGLKREVSELLIALKSKMLFSEIIINNNIIFNIKSFLRAKEYFASAIITERWLSNFIIQKHLEPKETIFYSYWFDRQTLGLCLVKAHSQIIVISRAHATDLYEDRNVQKFIPARRWALGIIDRVFVISEFGKKYLISRYGKGIDNKVCVSRLGVPPSRHISRPSTDNIVRIVSCSNLDSIKRIDLLIDGLSELHRIRPKFVIEWIHYGGGSLYHILQKYAESKLKENISFKLAGNVPNEEILAHYQNHPVDLFINTSSSEGIPVTIMEAHSYGIPVIAPDVGGINEIVSDETGMLMSANPSPEEIAKSIIAIYENQEKALMLRHNAYKNWEKRYDSNKNYGYFSNSLLSLINNTAEKG